MEPIVLQVLSTPGAQGGAPTQADNARWVRDALRHLYDPVYLQTHPLTGVLTEQERSATPSAKGQRLRQVLLAAIAALQPASPRDDSTTGRRSTLLTLRYVEALDRDEVCARLAISQREYDRAHRQALAAVVSLLRDTATPAPAPVSSPSHRPTPPVTGHAPATSHLPRPLTSFIGRAQELREVRQLLEAARLVTLTGPPGTGKTRLALQVADELAASGRDATTGVDGIVFVPLASIRDPELVVPALAQALAVRDTPPHSVLAALEDQLRDRHTLLILDNFEQVLDAAPVVAQLLAACPHLTVLVTSRASLRLSGEHDVVVPPLQAPAHEGPIPLEQLARYDAVRLYVERARAVQARFRLTDHNAPAVRALCRRLDGLPLAIELAAARSRIFPPYALLGRLTGRGPGDHPGSTGDAPGSSLPLLIGGARDLPARQQTLHSAIDWSYRLLTADEQRLFARLAVFAGGWTLEAAEAVCAAPGALNVLEGLASLVDKSLVRPEELPDGGARFSMLETMAEYARAHLAALGAEGRTVHRRHAEYVLALAQEAEAQFWGRAQALWLRRLNGELGNLRAALAWSRDQGEVELALQLGGALFWFWHDGGHWTEARAWLESALAVATPAHRTAGRAAALAALGLCKWCLGDVATARVQSEESLAIYREVEDRRGMGRALHGLGVLAAAQGEVARAHGLLEEGLSLARAVGDRPLVGLGLHQLGLLAMHVHDEDTARARIEESRRVWQELGSTACLSLAASSLGDLARARGAFAEAAAHYREGLELLGAAGPPGWRITYLHNLGHVLHRQGEDGAARALFAEALVLCRALGDRRGVAESVAGLACLVAETQPERTARLCGAATAVIEAMGAPVSRPNQVEYDQGLAVARRRLGDDAFEAAWRHGQALPLEQAVTEALDEQPPLAP